jgi:RNA polymerase sigma-70 factor, ECF subfamily
LHLVTPNLPTESDEELARQAQAGSPDAFEQLVFRFEHRIHAFVFQCCRHRTDAVEITQDTFVKAFQCLGQFDARRNFAAWLFTIARRLCIDRQRAAPRRAEEPATEPMDDADPAELTARREEGQHLWQIARRQLGENQYQALWLHYVDDLDVARIAQVMGKTRVNVKVLLFRARQILARHVSPGQLTADAAPAFQPGSGARPPARPSSKFSTPANHESLAPKI